MSILRSVLLSLGIAAIVMASSVYLTAVVASAQLNPNGVQQTALFLCPFH